MNGRDGVVPTITLFTPFDPGKGVPSVFAHDDTLVDGEILLAVKVNTGEDSSVYKHVDGASDGHPFEFARGGGGSDGGGGIGRQSGREGTGGGPSSGGAV